MERENQFSGYRRKTHLADYQGDQEIYLASSACRVSEVSSGNC